MSHLSKFPNGLEIKNTLTVTGAVQAADYVTQVAPRGYTAGGYTQASAITNKLNKVTFLDDSIAEIAATLSLSRIGGAGVNSSSKGYILAGWTGGTSSTEIDGIDFSTDSAINPSAVTGSAVALATSINSSTVGYHVGGVNAGTITNTIGGFEFSGQTSTVPSDSTLTTSLSGAVGLSISTHAYILGGDNRVDTLYTSVYKYTFTSETETTAGNTLTNSRSRSTGINNDTKGLITGGYRTSYATVVNTISEWSITSELEYTVASTLGTIREYSAEGINERFKGYVIGGHNGSGTIYSSIETINFGSEVLSLSSNTIAAGNPHIELSGIQAGRL